MPQFALRRVIALSTLALASFAASAAQIDVAGVKLDDAIDLRGSKLQLNGAGVRYKAVFKVYTAALYLGKKVGTPEEVLAAPGAKRMTITMLRDIDANELGKLFTRGVEDNSPKGEMSQLIPGLLRMSQVFSEQKQLKAGDSFTIDWLPSTGTVISVRGVSQGDPIKEQAFFNALVRIWLGPSPADWKLKDALLGKG
ncbi:chalcone isomerase family protein [Variovorax sp. J22P240]|uniref:chalcone isomerase family protein n=1 Tax=unclassified Variovorax TaxID=663243 RepID=UPI002576D66B|nr:MULTISPECIES: chalcone isomerase family protein [unclassified Variovorax]MDM0001387.1 chalcone isomerase family protein [Variovorax sp. J22P240]MDM0050938.1 chalcone isomerase family protein [Variovorax sp. J22R115]